MIGSALKKIAKNNNMKIDNGAVYGDFRGYNVTLTEGVGYKQMAVSGNFFRPGGKDDIEQLLQCRDIKKEFRIQKYIVSDDGIILNFYDNPGTMKMFDAFVEWFFPLLPEYGITGTGYCPECGELVSAGKAWTFFSGGIAMPVHDECLRNMQKTVERDAAQEELEEEERNASYATGFLGAVLGGLLGSLAWATVMYFGYIMAVLGFLIGVLSKKGYEKFNGKKGPGKVVAVIVGSVVGILAGCLESNLMEIIVMIVRQEIYATFADIPAIFAMLFSNTEYMTALTGNIIMGILFSLLGMIDVFRSLWNERKIKKLKTRELR